MGRGTAEVSTYGGLVTSIESTVLPDGVSPMNWDVDYLTASVFTRPGLVSVFSYTTVLNITNLVISSGNLGIFTYNGPSTPVSGEQFTLSGFTGSAFFLNGQTITVLYVNALLQQITVDISGTSGTYN